MGMGLEAVMALLYKELETQQTKATHFYRERERERDLGCLVQTIIFSF